MKWGMLALAVVAAATIPLALPDRDPLPAETGMHTGDEVVYETPAGEAAFTLVGAQEVRDAWGAPHLALHFATGGTDVWIDLEGGLLRRGLEDRQSDGSGESAAFRFLFDGDPPCVLVVSMALHDMPACELGGMRWGGGEASGAYPSPAWGKDDQVAAEFTQGCPFPARLSLGDVVWTRKSCVPGTVGELLVWELAHLPIAVQEPMHPWGIDDAHWSHGWPLAEAYATARDDPLWPAFRAWLADREVHPVKAQHFAHAGGRETWMIHVQDESEGFTVWVERPGVVHGVDVPARSGGGPVSALAAEAPELTLSFSALTTLAAAHVGPLMEDFPPNSYSLEMDGDDLVIVFRHLEASADPLAESARVSRWYVEMTSAGEVREVAGEYAYVGAPDDAPSRSVGLPQSIWTGQQLSWPTLAEAWPLWASALALLARGIWLAFYSRVLGDALAQHPTRRQLLDIVGERPGIHRAELARALAMHARAIDHHVRLLVRAGLLATRHQGSLRGHYLPGAPWPPALSPPARRVLECVAAQPGRSIRDIAASLGISASTVHYHVRRLRVAGLLDDTRDGPAPSSPTIHASETRLPCGQHRQA